MKSEMQTRNCRTEDNGLNPDYIENEIDTRRRKEDERERESRVSTYHMTAHKPFPVSTCHRLG